MAVSSILSHAFITASFTYIFYLLGLVIYRLYFHPLAKFPGPKYAAISRWHEFYYEVVKKGQFTFKVQELHKQYGMSPLRPMRSLNRRQLRESLTPSYQAPSSVSSLTSFTSKTPNSTKPSTPKLAAWTNMIGCLGALGVRRACLPQHRTTSIAFAVAR